jgi:putative membrane protein
MWWHAHEGMGWWMLFGGVLWILFWASIIYLIVSVLAPKERRERYDHDDPLEIAKRRYAQGEITREEFEQIQRDLTSHPT